MKTYSKRLMSLLLAIIIAVSVMPISTLSVDAATNESTIYNFCIDELGVNVASACGILANIQKESSFNPTASCIDTNGKTSYGICQWNGNRFTNLKNWCSKNGYSYSSLTGQLYYLKHELNNSESSAFNKVKSVSVTSSGAYNAGYNWAKYFERCSSKYYSSRAELASNTYWKKYGKDDSKSGTVYDPQIVVDLALSKVGKMYANGYCLSFVKDMFKSAYGFTSTACCAYNYGANYIDSSSKSNIPLGADVFFSGSDKTCKSCKHKCGHVGIYVGDGYIVHAWGGKVVKMKIDKVIASGYPYRGWGWHGNKKFTVNQYNITSNNATNVANTSATISASLNKKANVQKWGYYISTNKNEVKNVDGTNATKTHVDTKTMDYCRVKDWSNSPQSTKIFSVKVSKILGNKLKPGTTYYYKFVVKIGGVWYQCNDVKSFKTTSEKPKSTELKVSGGSTDIGINDTATVTWSAASGAESYTVKLFNSNNSEVFSKKDINGTTYTFPASCFKAAGKYTAKLYAVNAAGTTNCSGTPVITVHNNVTVTFYDTVSNTIISSQSVVYGHDADAPVNPSQTGYTFKKWDSSYTKVKSDITVKTVYDTNQYTVKFVDGYSNETISSAKYSFNTVLNSDEYPTAPSHKNYKFIGWSEEEYKVGAETHTVYARYEWDLPTGIAAEIENIERAKSDTSETVNDGYSVTVKITAPAGTTKTIKGRAVIALKTAKGRLLIETESSAFVLYPSETKEQIKEIEVFVPYEATDEDLAAVTEVYVVNDYSSAGIISNVDHDTVKTAASNADEWQFSTVQPVIGENGVVDTDDALNYVTYDLETTTTKDSLATSMSGFALKSSAWVQTSNGTIKYVKSWPRLGNTAGQKSKGTEGSQYNNNTTVGKHLYEEFNNTPKTASETATSKVTVSNESYGAIYYHWCCNRDNDNIAHNVTGQKWYADTTTKNKYYTFHAFWVGASDDTSYNSKTYVSSLDADFYVRNLSSSTAKDYRDKCTDSKYWKSRLPVYKQTWTQYTKKFTYTKTETETGKKAETMSAVPKDASNTTSTTSSGVTLNTTIATTPKNKTQWYAYKTEVSVDHDDKNQYDIAFELGADYAEKEVTVYVYKDNQVSDFTTEYIGTATTDENGTVSIPGAQMREQCSEATGDFTIAVALPGETNAMVVDIIEAPKPTYTVTYYDYDRETVVYQTKVSEGGTVTAPSFEILSVPTGYRFTGWDLSTVGVHSDLSVYPMSEKEVYSVVFINWQSQEVENRELEYGEYIEDWLPEIAEVEGVNTSWDLSGCSKISEKVEVIDENTGNTYETEIDVHVVTGNTVITTLSEVQTSEVTFLSETSEIVESGVLEDRDADGCLADSDAMDMISSNDIELVETVEYSDRIDTPVEIEESEDYIFFGWKNAVTGEYLYDTETTESGTYYPVYEFAETVEIPQADIKTGEYDSEQTVTLSCATDSAVIYYTTDGTDPEESDTAIEYTKPITLTKSCNLQFYATAFGMNNSGTVAELYAINTSVSGAKYHIVTVYSNLPQQEGEYYQALVKESAKFNDTDFKNIEGYQYNGLFYDELMTDEFYVSAETVTDSIVLYASYTPNQYTATFVDSDGTVLAESVADYGETAAAPDVLQKDGFVFIGWDSYDYECLVSDKTFTAQYCPENEYATVKLNISQKSVENGAAIPLKATIEPDELSDTELSWESSDSNVAEVDATGLVTFVGVGKATVTVTVESSGESAECVFTVTPNSDEKITLAGGSYLDIDDLGYLRRIPDGANTVGELKDQFINENLCYYNADGKELGDDDRIGTGTVIRLMDGNEVLDEIVAVMTGDYNGDGRILSQDVAMLSDYLVEKLSINDYQLAAMNVNGDKKVNVRDLTVLSKYRAGKAEMVY